MHCIAGVLTATCLGKAKFLGARRKYVFVTWEAVLFHSLYNCLTGTGLGQHIVMLGGVFFARAKLVDLAHVGLVDFHACVAPTSATHDRKARTKDGEKKCARYNYVG